MLADDIKKVEYYVDFGGPHNKVADAWTRIKTALEDSQKTPTNTTKVQICPKCVGTGIDGHGEDEVEGGCKKCKGSGKL